ncbi:patatin-like phospholipase family protein [Salinactinospora qingdaonensis]|uniref:Patatin-like phospholipase family protein n=1 Tax=Salinactinospora qingdaonensis TaxID=702744 RepID=A0ABP7GBB8_9ACTN
MESTALVLGGGGITGIAWEIGLLAGLREVGMDLTTAGLMVGTSAGSVVSSQLAGGLDPELLYASQIEPPVEGAESAAPLELTLQTMAEIGAQATDAQQFRAQLGARARTAPTQGTEQEHIDQFASRLAIQEWPERPLMITGVDAESGEPIAWTRDSEVPLLLAIAASCAVPLVWPPVTIDGRRYMDGGMRSPTNADLAVGADSIVVLAPSGPDTAVGVGSMTPSQEVASLGAGVRSRIIAPDSAALTAIGPNALDPARRAAAAQAGRAQATTELARELADLWPAA